jgi:hypothetical protein
VYLRPYFYVFQYVCIIFGNSFVLLQFSLSVVYLKKKKNGFDCLPFALSDNKNSNSRVIQFLTFPEKVSEQQQIRSTALLHQQNRISKPSIMQAPWCVCVS